MANQSSPRKRFHVPIIEDDDDNECGPGGGETYQASSLFKKVKQERVEKLQEKELREQKNSPNEKMVTANTTVHPLPKSVTLLPADYSDKSNEQPTSSSASLALSGRDSDSGKKATNLCDIYIEKLKEQRHQQQQGELQRQVPVEEKPRESSSSNSGEAASTIAVPKSVKTTVPLTKSILVNVKQKGNPVLKNIRNVPWQYGDIVADYQLGATTCALYLSLRYHHLRPDYIRSRLDQLGKAYQLRILLVQVDLKDPHHSVKELAKVALLAQCTLILAWSTEEAGRYLETYKAYESKPADMIKTRTEKTYIAQATHLLTKVRSINKTDVVTLLTTFGSIANVMAASVEEISLCPGFGTQKAQRVFAAFRQPFLRRHRAGAVAGGGTGGTSTGTS